MTTLERKCRKLVKEWRDKRQCQTRYQTGYQDALYRCSIELDGILPKRKKRKGKK